MRLPRKLLFLAVGAALLAELAVAAVAAAAGMPEIQVQLWPGAQAGQAIVITSVTLPESAKLPATVQLPVIDGLTIDWAGEVGSDVAQDQQREYQLKQGAGGKYAEFQMSQSRQAQVEMSGIPLTASGNTFAASVNYVQTVASDSTAFSVRLPAGASNPAINPTPTGAPATNETGESLYTLPSKVMKAGDKQILSVSYQTGAVPAQPGGTGTGTGSGGNSSLIIGLLIGLLALAVAALALMLGRQKRSSH